MKNLWGITLAAALMLTGCGVTQATVEERNAVLGERSASSNFFEAQQINAIENWKDDPAKIVFVYVLNPATGGLLIPPVQCQGVPASSTESLEPNDGSSSSAMGYGFQVPVDGYDIYSFELAGRDGTFGDPVHFRQCMTVEGHYIDFPAYGLPYLVTSQSYTFPDPTIKRDYETEAKLLQAEKIIERGGCIDTETLEEIECK